MHVEEGALGASDQILEHSRVLHFLNLVEVGQLLDAESFLENLIGLVLADLA